MSAGTKRASTSWRSIDAQGFGSEESDATYLPSLLAMHLLQAGVEVNVIALWLGGPLEFLQADDLPCGAAQDFGKIKSALLAEGLKIGAYDMLIAAHARYAGATVVTNSEREFRRVPGLRVENWLKP